jgi:hypothetical protein
MVGRELAALIIFIRTIHWTSSRDYNRFRTVFTSHTVTANAL